MEAAPKESVADKAAKADHVQISWLWDSGCCRVLDTVCGRIQWVSDKVDSVLGKTTGRYHENGSGSWQKQV